MDIFDHDDSMVSKRNRRKRLEDETHKIIKGSIPPPLSPPSRKELDKKEKVNFEKFFRQAKPKKEEQPIVIGKRRKK